MNRREVVVGIDLGSTVTTSVEGWLLSMAPVTIIGGWSESGWFAPLLGRCDNPLGEWPFVWFAQLAQHTADRSADKQRGEQSSSVVLSVYSTTDVALTKPIVYLMPDEGHHQH